VSGNCEHIERVLRNSTDHLLTAHCSLLTAYRSPTSQRLQILHQVPTLGRIQPEGEHPVVMLDHGSEGVEPTDADLE
jgi:hypothetical protein